MANVSITEFSNVEQQTSGSLLCPSTPFVTSQAFTATASTQSAAFSAATRFVRIISDANIKVAFGANPTATASSMPIRADMPEYFAVTAGSKIAAIEG